MIEYGYIDNGVLISRFITKQIDKVLDKDGKEIIITISEEEQIKKLSSDWKPVDIIDESKMECSDDFIIIIPIPYDAGEKISYKYEKEFDKQKVKNDINSLKNELSKSDYKITKSYESSLIGAEIPYNIKDLHIERQKIRDKINELEKLLP